MDSDEPTMEQALIMRCPEEQHAVQERVYGILFLGMNTTECLE